jgi:hypothetical protein
VDAIVHHGGAGTTAQAARAGKPSVVVPFFGDQRFWGQRVHRAGGGPPPIPRRALTTERLVSAIDEALHDQRIKERAALLGAQVRAERGLSTAVRLIEAASPGLSAQVTSAAGDLAATHKQAGGCAAKPAYRLYRPHKPFGARFVRQRALQSTADEGTLHGPAVIERATAIAGSRAFCAGIGFRLPLAS